MAKAYLFSAMKAAEAAEKEIEKGNREKAIKLIEESSDLVHKSKVAGEAFFMFSEYQQRLLKEAKKLGT